MFKIKIDLNLRMFQKRISKQGSMELPLLDGDWFSLVTRKYMLFIYVGI